MCTVSQSVHYVDRKAETRKISLTVLIVISISPYGDNMLYIRTYVIAIHFMQKILNCWNCCREHVSIFLIEISGHINKTNIREYPSKSCRRHLMPSHGKKGFARTELGYYSDG